MLIDLWILVAALGGIVFGLAVGFRLGLLAGRVSTFDQLLRRPDPHAWRVASETRRTEHAGEAPVRTMPFSPEAFGTPTPGPLPIVTAPDEDGTALIPTHDLVQRRSALQDAATRRMEA